MAYRSVAETASVWNISGRLVQKYCSEGRVAGAVRAGRAWMVPDGAARPEDMRKSLPGRESTPTPAWVFATRSARCAKGFLILREAEELYLRGYFREACMKAAESQHDHDARTLSLYLIAISSLNLGDSARFFRAEAELKAARAKAGDARAREADFAQAAIAVNAYSAEQCPRWIADCDLAQIDSRLRPLALSLCAKHALGGEDAGRALGLCEAALMYAPEYMAGGVELALRVLAGIAAARVRAAEKTRAHLARALEIALPRGFVTPFAEYMPLLKGLIEPPEGAERFLDRARALSRDVAAGRAAIRAALRDKNAGLLLNSRELRVARLKRDGLSDIDIARQLGASLKSVQAYLQKVYSKLSITSREELIKYIV